MLEALGRLAAWMLFVKRGGFWCEAVLARVRCLLHAACLCTLRLAWDTTPARGRGRHSRDNPEKGVANQEPVAGTAGGEGTDWRPRTPGAPPQQQGHSRAARQTQETATEVTTSALVGPATGARAHAKPHLTTQGPGSGD